MRLRHIVGLLAAGVTLLAAGVAPAGATTLVSPSTDLVNGQTVTVSGTASSGAAPLNVYECAFATAPVPGSVLDTSGCDPSNVVAVTPGSDGSFSTSYVFNDPYTTGGGQTVDCSVQACEIVVDNPNPGDVVMASMVTGNECDGFFMGADSGSIVKTTSAGPNGASVTAGETVTVTLTWNPADFSSSSGGVPDKVTDCVKVAGMVDTTLSGEFKPGPAGGTQQFIYQVPDDPAGTQICDRGAVGSATVNTEKSAILCYTIGPSTILPEAPAALFLPLIALIIVLGAFMWMRRRKVGQSA